MAIEIEKKYRLTKEERDRLIERLHAVKAEYCGEELEENTLYAGGVIDMKNCVLRLRRTGDDSILTYKERLESSSDIKQQREEETRVESGEVMADILVALGYHPALVYENRRMKWRLAGAEVDIDELPFGLFMEIEGSENSIADAEKLLEAGGLKAEMATYPQLACIHGKKNGEMIEARF